MRKGEQYKSGLHRDGRVALFPDLTIVAVVSSCQSLLDSTPLMTHVVILYVNGLVSWLVFRSTENPKHTTVYSVCPKPIELTFPTLSLTSLPRPRWRNKSR